MIKYQVQKWNEKGMITDYGSFTNVEDVEAIVKGYKLEKELNELFDLIIYTRKNTKNYYSVDIIYC